MGRTFYPDLQIGYTRKHYRDSWYPKQEILNSFDKLTFDGFCSKPHVVTKLCSLEKR